MPQEGVKSIPHDEILRVEEFEAIVRAAAQVGIKKIRLTGGEPLVHKESRTLSGVLRIFRA
jgi:cyclic pyranopterin phosphate synthase